MGYVTLCSARQFICVAVTILVGVAQVDAEPADYHRAEAFTPKEVMRRLYGDLGLTDAAHREDSFAPAFDPEIVRPQWIDGERFWYVYREAADSRLVIVDAASSKRNTVWLKHLAAAAQAQGGGAATVRVTDVDADANIVFSHGERSWRFDSRTGRADPMVVGSAARRPGLTDAVAIPDGSGWLGLEDYNLWIEASDGKKQALSRDGELWRDFCAAYGMPDSRLPMHECLGWFAGGRRFWIERWDNRQVGEAWVINSLQRPRPTLTSMRLAFPGEANLPIPELWVGDLDAGTLVQIDTSRWPGQLISGTEIGGTGAGNISSAGSADRLHFVRISRGYQDVELVVADAVTGRTRVLLHEKSEPYFSIRTPLFRFLNDGSFLWLSDRTGWNHLYRYDANGTLLGSVTGGDFNVAEILHVDAGRGWIYFKGFGRERGRNPYFEHTYRVRTDGTRLSLLTPEDAAHTTSISPNGRWLVDVYSRPDQVPQAVVRASDGKRRYLLEQLDIRSLVAGGWSAPESFTATAADGKTTLHGTLWKPHRFDPQRRYPVISYVTPNPNYIGHIAVRFNPATRFESLAQLGFIVAAASTRGQGQGIRDKAFLVHGRGDVRDYPLADSKTALEQAAASRPYMDLSRAGVTGYSGGGLMAASLLLTYPDFYKAAVSGAGNHDNNIYDWASGEHYFGNGVPGTALAQTRMSTNQELAANLQGDLLLVHSDTDRNVPMTHSLRLADALVDAGKRFDFLVIPGRDHNLRDRWSYYDRVVWCYFAQRLLGDERQCVDLWKLH